MPVRTWIHKWHAGQLVIAWIVLILAWGGAALCLVWASGTASDIGYSQERAVKDSTLRADTAYMGKLRKWADSVFSDRGVHSAAGRVRAQPYWG